MDKFIKNNDKTRPSKLVGNVLVRNRKSNQDAVRIFENLREASAISCNKYNQKVVLLNAVAKNKFQNCPLVCTLTDNYSKNSKIIHIPKTYKERNKLEVINISEKNRPQECRRNCSPKKSSPKVKVLNVVCKEDSINSSTSKTPSNKYSEVTEKSKKISLLTSISKQKLKILKTDEERNCCSNNTNKRLPNSPFYRPKSRTNQSQRQSTKTSKPNSQEPQLSEEVSILKEPTQDVIPSIINNHFFRSRTVKPQSKNSSYSVRLEKEGYSSHTSSRASSRDSTYNNLGPEKLTLTSSSQKTKQKKSSSSLLNNSKKQKQYPTLRVIKIENDAPPAPTKTAREKILINAKFKSTPFRDKDIDGSLNKKPSPSLLASKCISDLTKLTSDNSTSNKPLSVRDQSKAVSNKINHNCIQIFNNIKTQVEYAKARHKTFTAVGVRAVRRALLKRGWIEKISYKMMYGSAEVRELHRKHMSILIPMLADVDKSPVVERIIKSKLLHGFPVDFCYGTRSHLPGDHKTISSFLATNKEIFTCKGALSMASSNRVWKQHPYGQLRFNHPRTYHLSNEDDVKVFINDFNITAAISLIQLVAEHKNQKKGRLINLNGKVPLHIFDFAVQECENYVRKIKGFQIAHTSKSEWEAFVQYYYKIAHNGIPFASDADHSIQGMVIEAEGLLQRLKRYCPHLHMDGTMNLWILKPCGGSCGNGIHVCRSLSDILRIIQEHFRITYVVQKYIERPLLIYNTKFDIRQWFLITSIAPITVWIYEEFYLRFSCRNFNLKKLHESIHLTNNSVQCKYKNHAENDLLPSYSMWECSEFEDHLKQIGYPHKYEQIFNGMCESITAAVLRFLPSMDTKDNQHFQLFGADFMITDDFTPWLIEINSQPAMHNSTPVTARMCPKMQEDLIKVVIDYKEDKSVDTGKFKLIYQETKLPPLADKAKMSLSQIAQLKDFTTNKEFLKRKHKQSNSQISDCSVCTDDIINFVQKNSSSVMSIKSGNSKNSSKGVIKKVDSVVLSKCSLKMLTREGSRPEFLRRLKRLIEHKPEKLLKHFSNEELHRLDETIELLNNLQSKPELFGVFNAIRTSLELICRNKIGPGLYNKIVSSSCGLLKSDTRITECRKNIKTSKVKNPKDEVWKQKLT